MVNGEIGTTMALSRATAVFRGGGGDMCVDFFVLYFIYLCVTLITLDFTFLGIRKTK